MPNYRNAKELMAEMYPVKMAAGGIIGNIGILQAAAIRPSNPLTPEQRNYLDQFKAYEDQYNTQFMPAYEAFRPQYDEWMTGFNQAAEGINRGQFDLRLDATKSGERTQLERLKAQGWQVVNQGSKHQTIRPTQVQQVYTAPEPRMAIEAPTSPAFPSGISSSITPEQQKYLDDYAAFQQRYTQEYLPAYEQFAPAMANWEAQYAKALADMNAGAFNKRLKKDSKRGTAEMQRLVREGWTVTGSSNHWNVSPTSVSQVFKQAAPTLSVQRPEEPGALEGYKSAEDVQRAIAEQVERDILAKQRSQRGGKTGLNVFANPAQFNLAGFAGSSTFNEPEAREFFAKGGEVEKYYTDFDIESSPSKVKALMDKAPKEGGLTYKDYPTPYGLRAYEKEDGYGGEMMPKYKGWAGEQEGTGKLKGSKVTEYSLEDEKGSFPSINPLLSIEEINLVASGVITPSIYKKAVEWRDLQESKGESPFLNPPGFAKGGEVDKFDADVLAGTQLSPNHYNQPEYDLIISKASKKDLEEFDKRIAEQAVDTNVSVNPSRYIRENSTIFPFSDKLNAAGFVDPEKPDEVNIEATPRAEYLAFLKSLKAANPKMQAAFDRIANKHDLDTLVHEMTHTNQIRDAVMSDREHQLRKNLADRYNIQTRLEDSGTKQQYLNPMSGSGLSGRELGAYLSSYEGLHPSTKTVDGKKVIVPFERSYLGQKVIPSATGLLRFLEETGLFGGTIGREEKDPEALKYLDKIMGREKRKPTSPTKNKK